MKQFLFWVLLSMSGAIALGCQSTSNSSASSQDVNQSTAIASPSNVSTQILSGNAYKVPYLGYDGIFHLNAENDSSTKDSRNPKRIGMYRMEKFAFYKDSAGKTPIARDCHYAYLGAVPDSKYYSESKTAVWDVFELENTESKDPACKQFKYLSFIAPHAEPIHMHFRYGNEQSSFQTLVNMSNDKEDKAKFNPWWATYCGGGKTGCGKEE